MTGGQDDSAPLLAFPIARLESTVFLREVYLS